MIGGLFVEADQLRCQIDLVGCNRLKLKRFYSFDTMGILSSGLLAPEEAMDLLLIGPSYAQVAIKTEKAARQLHWLRSERIVQMNEEERLAEQTAYQEALAAAMEGKTV